MVSLILKSAPARFAAVGLSMGGYLALEIMRQQPERVSALILLDTRASPDAPEDVERRLRTIDLAKKGQFDALHSVFWPRLVHPTRQGDKALEGIVRQMMDETGAARFIRQQSAIIARPDYRVCLQDIAVPVLVGVGREDVITPPDMTHALADGIPGSQRVIFDNCGHLSTLEQPALLTRTIAAFLHQEKERER